MPNKEIRAFFEKYDIKYTKQRSAIYDILVKADEPLTAENIYLECKKSRVSTSLSTIYRILDMFIDKKIVIIAGSDGKKSTYQINSHEHKHHMICLRCKKKITIEDCPLEKYEKSLCKSTNFEITDHKLDIYGYCPSCK